MISPKDDKKSTKVFIIKSIEDVYGLSLTFSSSGSQFLMNS